MLDGVTLDQLRFLAAIDDCGSFTAAAKRLGRAQSAVSHAVATLELQLDLQLFDRSTRKPALTPAGEAILSEARSVLVRAERLKATAAQLATGVEGELIVASGVIVPENVVFDGVGHLASRYPDLAVTLFREEIGGPLELLSGGRVNLAFTGRLDLSHYPEDAFEKQSMGSVGVVSVAAPDHPLSVLGRSLTDADLADHRQLVPVGRARPAYENTLVHRVWGVGDLAFRVRLIKAGLGWGTVPTALATPQIDSGALVRLRLEARPDDALRVPLFACWRTGDAPGPAAQALIRNLSEGLSVEGDATA
ncbi:MAG: LysR family transcriptional regulator [Litorimonas sp.]